MRLGDLDALKQAFTEECCGCCDNCSHCLTGYKCELIDNAPTVEERPQGEWLPFKYNFDLPEPSEYGSCVQILTDEKETNWEEYWGPEFVCSKCHAKNHKANYCPNCGAEMKGGAE